MKMMRYKNFTGSVEYSRPDQVYHGKLLGIPDLVTFESADERSLEIAFNKAVDDYLSYKFSHRHSPA